MGTRKSTRRSYTRNQWTKLGIKVDVQYSDYSLIRKCQRNWRMGCFSEAWQTYGDEYALLSGQFSQKVSANYGKYNDAEVNAFTRKFYLNKVLKNLKK